MLVERNHPTITLVRQAELLDISRASLYYKPKKPPLDETDKNKILTIMEEHPAYGARRVA